MITSGIECLCPRKRLPWGHHQSSDPERVSDLIDIDGNRVNDLVENNNEPFVNRGDKVPTVNNDVNESDEGDVGLQENLRIFLEYCRVQ